MDAWIWLLIITIIIFIIAIIVYFYQKNQGDSNLYWAYGLFIFGIIMLLITLGVCIYEYTKKKKIVAKRKPTARGYSPGPAGYYSGYAPVQGGYSTSVPVSPSQGISGPVRQPIQPALRQPMNQPLVQPGLGQPAGLPYQSRLPQQIPVNVESYLK